MKHVLTILFMLSSLAVSAQSPCTVDDHYRQFDFWIGEWDVYRNGELAGTNDVKLLLDSCVVMENWESANNNYSGKSFNYLDNQTKTWHQTWVDNQGGFLWFEGKRTGNKLSYAGKSAGKNGKTVRHRMIFTLRDDGSVRQLWESSEDGQSWNVLFDGLYIPRGADINQYATD